MESTIKNLFVIGMSLPESSLNFLSSHKLFEKNLIPMIFTYMFGEDYVIRKSCTEKCIPTISYGKIYDNKIFFAVFYDIYHGSIFRRTRKICVYSEKTKKLLYSFPKKSYGHFDIYNSLLYLCSSEENKVIVSSLRGKELFSIEQITSPYKICVKDDKIVILHNNLEEISIFDHSHNLLTKFYLNSQGSDFTVSSHSIFVSTKSAIFEYDFRGSIIKKITDTPEFPNGFGQRAGICLIDDKYLAICYNDKVLIMEIQSEKIVKVHKSPWDDSSLWGISYFSDENGKKFVLTEHACSSAFVLVRQNFL